ncbi:hypothetical protein IAR50_005231 [Cryptococcus sp. DSM 104548]
MDPPSPTHAYRFPHPPPMPPDPTAALAHVLAAPRLSRSHAVDALQEHVFRAMGQGRRVREWCNHATQAIGRAPPSLAIGEALATPTLTALLPFTRLPSSPYFPTPEPPLPPPLLPNSSLAALTRNQLIDALARLSKEDRMTSKRLHYEQELVLELCLEYIGRRWRSAESVNGDVVDDISKKLTEVEFQVHLQGYPPTVRNALSPVLHKLRHTLGFITSSQLVAKLNSTGPSAYPYPPCQPEEIISSWVVRRLQAGANYLHILHELRTVQSGLSDDELLLNVLRPLGLAPAFSSPSQTLPKPTERQPKSLSFKPKITPRWFSHKRASSSITKPHPTASPLSLAAAAADHRRPSLPVISSASSLLSPPCDADRPSSRASICSSLGCTDVQGVQATLLGQLLDMRYHIHGHEDEGWFLGGGREMAKERLLSLRARSGKDEELQAVFSSLCAVFSLPTPTLHGKGTGMHTRDVSFDLDQYLRDISLPVQITKDDDEEGDSMETLCGARCGTSASMRSSASIDELEDEQSGQGGQDQGGKRVSHLSTFTIRKAVRKEGIKHRAVEFRFPRLPQLPELAPPTTPPRARSQLAPSRSVPDFDDGGNYTRLPGRVLRKGRHRDRTRSALQLRINTTTALPLRPLLSPLPLPLPLPDSPRDEDLHYTFPDHSLPLTPTSCYSTATGMATGSTARSSLQMHGTDQVLTRRQIHRQCVIFDGAPISPGTGAAGMDDGTGLGVYQQELGGVQGYREARWSEGALDPPISQTSRTSSMTHHEPAHYPSPESPILSTTPTFHHPPSPSPSPSCPPPSSPVPLFSILALFQSLFEGRLLEAEDIESALGRFIEDEQRAVKDKGEEWDAEARCRVAWLIEQVAVLLDDPVYLPAITTPALSLSPPPTPPGTTINFGLGLGLGTAPLNLSPVKRAPSSKSFSHVYASAQFANVGGQAGRGYHSASYC